MDLVRIRREVREALEDLLSVKPLSSRHLLVVGCSTSEVAGRRIGTSGSRDIAAALFEGIREIRDKHGFHLAFQCCEHLNRALVVEAETLERFGLTEVTAVPVPEAGGAMAAHAFRHLRDARLAEHVRADAAIDIGETLIGMHLKPVAVPVRPRSKTVGEARVTLAATRPKLIGGARAVYELKQEAGPSARECR
ncbi:TIGR01440 family protein [Staphylospora marina]|uniref:TIGR01440 family protein n=1 Tax=Staphylospora marina TaxID=2490858 RepID=UPI0019D20719|nr:TIGR01440 family protein [Staphylospora marina]